MKTVNKLYERINEKIIQLFSDQLKGKKQFWFDVSIETFARNPASKHWYGVLNNIVLQISLQFTRKGYYLNRWLTFLQVQEVNAKIKKGSFADLVVFASHIWVNSEGDNITKYVSQLIDSGQQVPEGCKKIPFLKGYNVFNVADVEGLPEEWTTPENIEMTETERITEAERIIKASGAVIDETNINRALYNSYFDIIKMPKRWQFNNSEEYYKTLFHELGHWTGHATRLNREQSQEREKYAFEELVAELTAAYCCAKLNISADLTDNAAYLQSWLKALDNDMKFFTQAAAQAQKATDYLLNFDVAAEERRAA
jgi:antirestriction protein ArdC